MSELDFNTSVGFYEILGVDNYDEDIKEIRKKYIKLVTKYHPDRNKNADPEIFELIQKAWNIIGNPKRREEYDYYLRNKENNIRSHDVLKDDFKRFMELDTTKFELLGITKDELYDKLKEDFNKANVELEEKHMIDFKDKENNNDLEDLIFQREQEEIEFSNEKLFEENQDFNLAKFNGVFDKYNKKSNNNNSLMVSQPMAYEVSQYANSDYMSYDKLYSDFNESSNYSSINLGEELKINKDNLQNIKEANYTNNFKLSENERSTLNNSFDDYLKKRELETKEINNMSYNDFKESDRSYRFLDDFDDKFTLDKENIEKIKNAK